MIPELKIGGLYRLIADGEDYAHYIYLGSKEVIDYQGSIEAGIIWVTWVNDDMSLNEGRDWHHLNFLRKTSERL